MERRALSRATDAPDRMALDPAAVLGALPGAVLVVDGDGRIGFVNAAAEEVLKTSASHLRGQALVEYLPADNPLFALIEQVRRSGAAVTEHGIELASPRIGRLAVDAQAAPFPDANGFVVVVLHGRSIAEQIDRRLSHRGAARSVAAMAAMLAHEVKNPLSGIRGAAQLLESALGPDDRALTTLIRDETDRICALVDRMGMFGAPAAGAREAVNIHLVLDRVRQIARSGFARHARILEVYDPSLPPVLGDRDALIQVLLNLVKNAAEALPAEGGEIVLATAYRHGFRIAMPGRSDRVHLPIMVSVQDNGAGIPDDIRPNLFDPFVTSKLKGTGLGLALVAKVVGDHGGAIEFESRPRETVFRLMLPVAPDARPEAL